MQKVPSTVPKIKKKIGKTSKLKNSKRSKTTIIPQKKGMANMFKKDKIIPVKKGLSFLAFLLSVLIFPFLDSL